MINWEVVVWTCITLAVLMGIIAMILFLISANNMRKKRKTVGSLYSDLAIDSKVMFAGGIYGKVVGIKDDILRVEVAPKTILEISRYAVQELVK